MFDIKKILFYFKKNFSKKDFILFIIIGGLFLLTRLVNLEKLPVFCDEGIYIRWAKVAWHDATWRFISLTDGRQPLQTWATIPFLKLFPNDALLAGRLFSVTSGLITLLGIFCLLYYLFDKKTAWTGAFLYVITPYFIFYDRIALADSAVNAGFVWILFFSILLVRTMRLDVAIIFGLISGLALLAKSSVKMFLSLAVLAPIIVWTKNFKKSFLRLLNFLLVFTGVAALALIIYNVQRLSPFMHYIDQKNTTFVMTVPELLKNPFAVFSHNLKTIPLYICGEMGWLIPFLGLLGLWRLSKKNFALASYLFLWILLPFMAIAFFSKVLFPRYLIFIGNLLMILSAYFLSHLRNKKTRIVFFAFIIAVSVYYNYGIIVDPTKLAFPPIDRGQYIEGETAGWGAREIMEYSRERSNEKPVIILAEGNFGLIADVLDVFIKPGDKISIRGYWPLDVEALYKNQADIGNSHVYVVFSQRKTFPEFWPIKLIKKYEKPGGKTAFYLFELQPK
ncbi:hypothetical protein GYA28_02985 [Candidatus Roizmanbacteria bacterium]|jgi:4-amino-4-deoxy-L-arabinose transferase-like glycosyltransferase|nr:hypothetical protein [Candidatus Roizmanbacteria bacterium]